VVERLGVPTESTVRKIIEEAREIAARVGESGLISADRVFGLLERQFKVDDIHAAVAESLRPSKDIDLAAHRVLLDLAKGPDGRTRLVTTNFDLLFEACSPGLTSWIPPRLPDPVRYDDLAGIVHLHGRVTPTYDRSDDGFVLSSSEFGRAYLSEGWATQFIQAVLKKYVVVFVGYTADDPPVQYLLEALNRGSDISSSALYAFQSGPHDDAQGKWRHKGVRPIPYSDGNSHESLWTTLEEWAVRARNPDEWFRRVVAFAAQSPAALQPHQRGQVAHLASTTLGVNYFLRDDGFTLPAEWICVFDPAVRYSRPRREYRDDGVGSFVDPFTLYGIDSDEPPPSISPDDPYVKRDLPKESWDAFAYTRLDRETLNEANLPAIRGHFGSYVPNLPPRLFRLGYWIQKVAHDPALVWWAGGQTGLHPDIQSRIRHEIDAKASSLPAEIRKAWQYLFEGWNRTESDEFDLRRSISIEGWSSNVIRGFGKLWRPFFTAERPLGSARPPSPLNPVRLRDLLRVDVEYHEPHDRFDIPQDKLTAVIREVRAALERAVVLELELSGFGLTDIVPIEPDPNLQGNATTRTFGLAVPFLFFVQLFRKLADYDALAARAEYQSWPHNEEYIFARLRIWVGGLSNVLTGMEAGQIFLDAPASVFWGQRHQRDLLLALRARWNDLSEEHKALLEQRLLEGAPAWREEEQANHSERRARWTLNRIHWLMDQGCKVSDATIEKVARLRRAVPSWAPEHAKSAIASLEVSSGFVRAETNFSPLLDIPLANVLKTAEDLSAQRHLRLVRNDPFAGLAKNRPVRALRTLVLASKQGSVPEWAWRTFLSPDVRAKDRPRLINQIAQRLERLSRHGLQSILYSVADWLGSAGPVLLEQFPATYSKIWDLLLSEFRGDPNAGRSTVIRGQREPEWVTEALNSPVGKLAQLIMADPKKDGRKAGQGFPAEWRRRAEDLLTLPGDGRRHALSMFAFNLDWFYVIDPAWTEKLMLSAIGENTEDEQALWAGFFWRNHVPSVLLYERIKPHLLRVARSGSASRRGHVNALAGILLFGWGDVQHSGRKLVTNQELRDSLDNTKEDFRLAMLWQFERLAESDDAWRDLVVEFLSSVWPRTRRSKSGRISARIAKLAISVPSIFPAVVAAAVPLIEKSNDEYLLLHGLTEKGGVVEQYPEETLNLLYHLLPADIGRWPHKIEEVLDRLAQALPTLKSDRRWVELKRQWDAR
jgi:hypothetical protein